MKEEFESVNLRTWDWRAFARLVAWVLIAALWQRGQNAALSPRAAVLLRDIVLLSLLSFGVFTHLFALVAMAAIRGAFFFDDAAYAACERLVRPIDRDAPFAVRFWTAFSVEVALVLGTVRISHAWALGPRLLELLR